MTNNLFSVAVTPVISTGAYAAGDNIGGLMKFKGADLNGFDKGYIQSLILADNDVEDAIIDLIFYSSDPSGSTFTDNAAQTIVDADLKKIIGSVTVSAYVDFAANSVTTKTGLAMAFDKTDAIYCSMVMRSTPTYTATTDITITLLVMED